MPIRPSKKQGWKRTTPKPPLSKGGRATKWRGDSMHQVKESPSHRLRRCQPPLASGPFHAGDEGFRQTERHGLSPVSLALSAGHQLLADLIDRIRVARAKFKNPAASQQGNHHRRNDGRSDHHPCFCRELCQQVRFLRLGSCPLCLLFFHKKTPLSGVVASLYRMPREIARAAGKKARLSHKFRKPLDTPAGTPGSTPAYPRKGIKNKARAEPLPYIWRFYAGAAISGCFNETCRMILRADDIRPYKMPRPGQPGGAEI